MLSEIQTVPRTVTRRPASTSNREFAAPPYGAPVEVVQAILAAGIRCGLIDVIHQGRGSAEAPTNV